MFNVIDKFGYGGMILCTLLAGLMLIGAGILRVGTLLKYIPKPVITGFTAGIAIEVGIVLASFLFMHRMSEVVAMESNVSLIEEDRADRSR